jgi:hypothetical protein
MCVEENRRVLTRTPEMCSGEDSDALEYREPMSNQQIDEIFKRLRALESNATNGAIPVSTRESWFKRNAYWFASSIALLTLLVGGGIGKVFLDLYVDSRVNSGLWPVTQTLTQLQVDLGEIKGELKRIAALRVIEDAAGASPEQLATNLQNLQKVLIEAKRSEQPLPDRPISEIQAKLLKVDASSSGYWPFVFDLISYRSIIITGLRSPPKATASEMSNVIMRGFNNGVTGGYVKVSGNIVGVRFANSWVEFDADNPAILKDVHFDHCVLVFVGFGAEAPSPHIQRMVKQILASNLSEFTVSS